MSDSKHKITTRQPAQPIAIARICLPRACRRGGLPREAEDGSEATWTRVQLCLFLSLPLSSPLLLRLRLQLLLRMRALCVAPSAASR